MNEQQSIFDTSFDSNLSIRRRELLPLALKIYIWVFMVLGGIFLLGGCFTMVNLFVTATGDGRVGEPNYLLLIVNMLSCLLPATVFLSISIPIWREAKWGIRVNWGFGVFLLLIITMNTINFSMGLQDIWVLFVPLMIFVPYWVMLFRVQKKWEQLITSEK